MNVLMIVSPQCQRAWQIASSLGEPIALAIAKDDSVFSSLNMPASVQRIRIWDEALDPSSLHPFDVEARHAAVIAQAARRLGTSVVLVTETQTGFVSAGIAEQLNLAHVSEVVSATLLSDGNDDPQLQVQRRGLRRLQVLRGTSQAVLAVLPSLQPDAASDQTSVVVTEWSLPDVSLTVADLPSPQLQVVAQSARHLRPRLFLSPGALVNRLRSDGLE